MDDIENDAVLLLSLLDESIFPHFLEWNKDQKDLSKWILLLLQTDFLRFKGLLQGKEERIKLAHFAYNIKQANQKLSLLTDREMATLDRLCHSKIPFKVALAPICQHIWRTVMIRTRQLVSSKYWSVMHNKIVTNPDSIDLDFILSNETYRRYFDRFLQNDPAELGALQCMLNARRLLLRTERLVSYQPATDTTKKTEDINSRVASIFTWRTSIKAVSGAYPYFGTTSSAAAKKPTSAISEETHTVNSNGISATSSAKDIHPHYMAFTDNLEAFKILLFGMRSLQKEFFPTASLFVAGSTGAALTPRNVASHRYSNPNITSVPSHRQSINTPHKQHNASHGGNAGLDALNICAGFSDTSRVEVMAVLAQHTAIKVMTEVDSLDGRFAASAAKTLYDLLLKLERELYQFLQQKFVHFIQSQEYMKLTALLNCEKIPQVWKYLDRANFLEGKIHREQLLHWASSEASGILYLPLHSDDAQAQKRDQDHFVDILAAEETAGKVGKKKQRGKVNFVDRMRSFGPTETDQTKSTQDMGENFAIDAPPVFALHFSACLPEFTALNPESLAIVPHRIRLWATEKTVLPAIRKYRKTNAFSSSPEKNRTPYSNKAKRRYFFSEEDSARYSRPPNVPCKTPPSAMSSSRPPSAKFTKSSIVQELSAISSDENEVKSFVGVAGRASSSAKPSVAFADFPKENTQQRMSSFTVSKTASVDSNSSSVYSAEELDPEYEGDDLLFSIPERKGIEERGVPPRKPYYDRNEIVEDVSPSEEEEEDDDDDDDDDDNDDSDNLGDGDKEIDEDEVGELLGAGEVDENGLPLDIDQAFSPSKPSQPFKSKKMEQKRMALFELQPERIDRSVRTKMKVAQHYVCHGIPTGHYAGMTPIHSETVSPADFLHSFEHNSYAGAEQSLGALTMILLTQLWRCNFQQDVDLEIEQDNHHFVLLKSMELQVLYQHLFGTEQKFRHSLGQLFLSVHTRLVYNSSELRSSLSYIQPHSLMEGNFPHLSRGKYRKVVHVSLVYAPAALFVDSTILTPIPFRSCYQFMQHIALGMQSQSHLPQRRMDSVSGVFTSTSQLPTQQDQINTHDSEGRIAPFSPMPKSIAMFDSPAGQSLPSNSSAPLSTSNSKNVTTLLNGLIVIKSHKMLIYDDQCSFYHQAIKDFVSKLPPLLLRSNDTRTETTTEAINYNSPVRDNASKDSIAAYDWSEETLYDLYLRFPMDETNLGKSHPPSPVTVTAPNKPTVATGDDAVKHLDSRRHLRDDDDDSSVGLSFSGKSHISNADGERPVDNWTAEERVLSITRHCGICDFSMAGMLTTLGLRLWLQIFMLILTDRKVVLVSSSPTLLSKVYFMLHHLIWPFKITHTATSPFSDSSSDDDQIRTPQGNTGHSANNQPEMLFQAHSDPLLQAYYMYMLGLRAHDPFFTYLHTAEELLDYFGIQPHESFCAAHPSLFYLQKQRSVSTSIPPTPFNLSADSAHPHSTLKETSSYMKSLRPFQNADSHSGDHSATNSNTSTPPISNGNAKANNLLKGIVNPSSSSAVASPDGTPAEDPSSWHARASSMFLSPNPISASTSKAPALSGSIDLHEDVKDHPLVPLIKRINSNSSTTLNVAATETEAMPEMAATSPSVFSRVVCVDVRAYRQAQRMLNSAQSIQLPFIFPLDYDDQMYTVFDLDTSQQISQSGFLRREVNVVSGNRTPGAGNSNSNNDTASPSPSFNGITEFSSLDLRNPLLFRTVNFPAFRELHQEIHSSTMDLFHAVIAAQLLTKPPPNSGIANSSASSPSQDSSGKHPIARVPSEGSSPRLQNQKIQLQNASTSLFGRVGFKSDEYHHSRSITLRSSQSFIQKEQRKRADKADHLRKHAERRNRQFEIEDDDDDDYEEENVRRILTTDDIHLFKHTDSVASIASVLTGAHLTRKATMRKASLANLQNIPKHGAGSALQHTMSNNSSVYSWRDGKTGSSAALLLSPNDSGLWSSFNQSQRILLHLSQRPFHPPSNSSTVAGNDEKLELLPLVDQSSEMETSKTDVLIERFQERITLEISAIRASNVTIEHAFHRFWMVLLLQAVPESLHYDPHAEVLGCDMQALLAQLLTRNHGELRTPSERHHSQHHHHSLHTSSVTGTLSHSSNERSEKFQPHLSSHRVPAQPHMSFTSSSSLSTPFLVPMISGCTAQDIQHLSFEDFLTLYNDHTATAGVSLPHAWYAECLAGLSSSFVDLIQRHGSILVRHAY